MSKIEQNKEKKRQVILKAAQGVFLADGYALASMDKIASDAQVTKQTVYRYFKSKKELFQATLVQVGANDNRDFTAHLDNSDIRKALLHFATDFIHFHLSDEHIAIFRILIAEGAKSQEAISSFQSVGSNQTDIALSDFFSKRLNITDTDTIIRLWTSMLLGLREDVLMGMPKPNKQQIDKHATNATDFLLSVMA